MAISPCTRRVLIGLSRGRDVEQGLRLEAQILELTGVLAHTSPCPLETPQAAQPAHALEAHGNGSGGPWTSPTWLHRPRVWHTSHAGTPWSCQAHGQPLLATPANPWHGGHTSTAWAPHSAMLHAMRGAKTKVQVEYHPMREAPHDMYTTEPTNYLQLLGALRYAANITRLKHLVQSYGGAFHGPHLAAALARLPKLARYNDDDLVRGVVTSVPAGQDLPLPPRVPRPGTRPRPSYRSAAEPLAMQLMAMLVGQGNVKLVSPLQTEEQEREEKRKKTKGQKGTDKALSLWRLKGKEKGGPSSDLSEGEPMAARFMPREASTAVWALGTLSTMGVQLNGALAERAANECLGALLGGNNPRLNSSKASPVDVALLVKGLAQLRAWPRDRAVLDQLAEWTVANVDRFTAQDVQMTLRSFVTLGYRDLALTRALARRAHETAKGFTPQQTAGTLKALAVSLQAVPVGVDPILHAKAARSASVAMKALAAGVAPQIILMSHEDLTGLATGLGQLGQAFVSSALKLPEAVSQPSEPAAPAGGQQPSGSSKRPVESPLQAASRSATNPAGLPPWLHGLACFLADKALRDLDSLEPLQLAAVLDMLVALRVPHGPLLKAVVDGVLAEDKVDPSLPPAAATSLVRAVTVLRPLLGPEASASMDPPTIRAPQRVAPEGSPRVQAALFKRETALGLGNLLPPAPLEADVSLTAYVPLGLAVPQPEPLAPLPAGNDAITDAASRTRHYYQGVLAAGVPYTERAEAAMWRVVAVYAARGVLQEYSVGELAGVAGAVVAARLQGVGPLVEEILLQAEQAVQSSTQGVQSSDNRTGVAAVAGHAASLDQLAQLMSSTAELSHVSAQLSGAAAEYLQAVLVTAPQPVALLPAAVRVLAQCRAHGVEPAAAARQVASAYITAAAANGAGAGAWPGHTASGLAPAPRKPPGSSKRPSGSALFRLDGATLAPLLQACAASGALDDALVNAAVPHINYLLAARPSDGSSQLQWVLGCAAPLVQHVQGVEGQGKQLPAEVAAMLGLLLSRVGELSASASEAQQVELQALRSQLRGVKSLRSP